MSLKSLPNLPYLDALRPEVGWRTEFSVLATYSADLVVLAAALLALAGLDDDRGSGSKVDFANAVDQLGGKVRLLVQAGRLVSPVKTPKILTILDRYVREVGQDETVSSWHPKVALSNYTRDDGAVQWRLWIGSRNLTRDLSWDVGLLLRGQAGGDGSQVDGVASLGETLLQRAELPRVSAARVRTELNRVRWSSPAGCHVDSLRLLLDGMPRGLPPAPTNLRRLTVISPFLDGTTVKRLATWGDGSTARVLISSRPELAKLAQQAGKPLSGFSDLLCMDASAPGQLDSSAVEPEPSTSTDEEPEPRGLHAKLILAEHGSGGTLWTGSVNATTRGWDGPNAEVVVELRVGSDIVTGINAFVAELATTVRLEELGSPEDPDPIEERLEAARKHVVNRWHVVQRIENGIPSLTNDVDPCPPDSEIAFEVGLLAAPCTVWPRGAASHILPPVAASDVTEMITCCLRLQGVCVSWLQRAPLDPPPDDERDRSALARYLDPRTFLSWIRSLLTGEQVDDAGGDWDQRTKRRVGNAAESAGPAWWAPTIEDVLKAWSHDPDALRLVDKQVTHYLALYREQKDLEQTPEERQVIAEFHKTWIVLRRELVRGLA